MGFKYPFGRDKDKPLDQCSPSSLSFYVKNLKLGNPKFDESNIALAKECISLLDSGLLFKILEEINSTHPAFDLINATINGRTDAKRRPPAAPTTKKHTEIQKSVKHRLEELKTQLQTIYNAAVEAQSVVDLIDEDGNISAAAPDHTGW